MKKQFLLGLMAMTLPLSTWADDGLTVKFTDETKTSVEYAGTGTETAMTALFTVVSGETTLETSNGDYALYYTKQGSSTKVTPKDVGTYTVHITGLGEYLSQTATADITVTKKELSSVTLKEVTKTYGTVDADINLATFVELNEGDLQAGDQIADAVKCLELERFPGYTEGEDVGSNIKVYVKGKDEDGYNYTYTFKEGADIVNLTINPAELTITDFTRVYDGKTTDPANITVEEGQVTGIKDGETVEITFTAEAGVTLKDVGTYNLTAKTENKNYTVKNEGKVTYNITRAEMEIEPLVTNTLKKPYDGLALGDVTSQYDFKGLAAGDTKESLKLTMVQETLAGTNGGKNAGQYLIHVAVDGTPVSINNYSSVLKNYTISYNRDNLKYTIEPKTVKYYFTSEGKTYNGQEVTTLTAKENAEATTGDYLLVIDTDNGFVGKDTFAEEKTPKAIFAKDDNGEEVTVLDAGEYKLTVETAKVEEGNYIYEFDANAANANVYEIKQAKISVTVYPQTVAFGKITDGKIPADLLPTWMAAGTGTNVDLSDDVQGERRAQDAAAIRTMMEMSLSEAAATGESGEYENGIISAQKTLGEGETWNDTQAAILNNYEITWGKGKLTIEGFGEETPFVLDGAIEDSEDYTAEQSLLAKIKANAGAKYKKVIVKNLKSIRDKGILAEKWYNLVLPFEVTVRELSKMFGYAIVNIPNQNNTGPTAISYVLTMQKIPANTLMAFKVDADMDWEKIGDEIVFEDKKIVAPTTWVTDGFHEYVGVYETEHINGADYSFLWAQTGEFWTASNGRDTDIYPLGGYFKTVEGPAPTRILFENPDGSTTAVSLVKTDAVNATEGWYSIDGVKLNAQPTQKGIYINNGKKVVIK